jgi:2-polyprenyl-3-methyl-5-hydroxy-6-metoxy-1,4-benzoquinol methylase
MKTNVTPERIMQFAWGYGPTLIIEAAVQHRVFDHLNDSPKTVEQLAKKTGASERGLRAILNALVGLQFLRREQKRYALTPESAAFLVSTKPGYLGGLFKHMSSQIIPKWLRLEDVVRTGRPAVAVNQRKKGAKFFAEFVEALFPMSYVAASTLGEHLKISNTKNPIRVLDIAAGSGVWGIALAEQSPLVRISAVDWPEVLEVTTKVAKRRGLADRLTAIPGDLLGAEYGSEYHVATLGHILHSEGRERGRRILAKVFDALAPGGTIAIAEFVPNDERTGPPNALIFAVNMLVNTDAGDTFTFAEISEWLREAGFEKIRRLDAGGPSPLILATKPRK